MMNQKRYWLRGGITGIIIFGFSIIIFLITGGFEYNQMSDYLYLWNLWSLDMFFLIMKKILEFFATGALVGWLYGKIDFKKVQN